MKWDSSVDATTKQQLLQPQASPPIVQPTPELTSQIASIKTRAPWVSIESVMALAQSNASTQVVDAVGKMAASRTIDAQAQPAKSSWWEDHVYKKLKTVAKWTVAGLNFTPEFAQGGISQLVNGHPDAGMMISTSLGTMLNNSKDAARFADEQIVARKLPDTPEMRSQLAAEYTGSGFNLSEEQKAVQAERARRHRGTVNGSAWTVGRGAANTVFKPSTLPYNIFSGVLDALTFMYFDPTMKVSSAVKEFKSASTLIPRLTVSELAPLREAITSEAGWMPGLADVGLDGTKYANFSNKNARFIRLTDKLTKTETEYEVAKALGFNENIPNEVISQLAKTRTAEQTKSVFAQLFTVDQGGLTSEINQLQRGRIATAKQLMGNFFVERTPLKNSSLLTTYRKYLTEVPEKLLVMSGDDLGNSKAVGQYVGYMRTTGVTEEKIAPIINHAIQAFSAAGTAADRNAAHTVWENVMKETLKTHGVRDEIISKTMNAGRAGLDNIRAYLQDRFGMTTDNGMLKALNKMGLAKVPADQLEGLLHTIGAGTEMQVVSPLQISELLNRVQVLPDVRELRRLTSNRFFGFGEKIGSIAGRAERIPMQIISNEKEYDRLGAEIADLQKQIGLAHVSPKDVEVNALRDRIQSLQMTREGLKTNVMRVVRTGEERSAVTAIDYLQNKLWKPVTLMTGGYVVRNSIDAQVRMAFSGLPSVLTHPWEYIQLVMGHTKLSSLKGDLLSGLKPDEYVDFVKEAMQFSLRQQGVTSGDVFGHMKKMGVWNVVSRDGTLGGESFYTDAVSQNSYLVHADPLQRLAAQTMVEYGGYDAATHKVIVKRLLGYVEQNPKVRTQLERMYANGFDVGAGGATARTEPIIFKNLSAEELKTVLTQHIERVSIGNTRMVSGGVSDVEFAQAFNRVPLYDHSGNIVPPHNENMVDVISLEDDGAKKVGATVQLDNKGGIGIITDIRDSTTGQRYVPVGEHRIPPEEQIASIQPVDSTEAFGPNGTGSPAFRRQIKKAPISQDANVMGLPPRLKRELLSSEMKADPAFHRSMTKATDLFFGHLAGGLSRKLERSPVFRNFYYEQIAKYGDELSPEGAKESYRLLQKAADDAGVAIEKYVGNKGLFKVLENASTGTGTASLTELDDFAKFTALQKTKDLLFDASNRNNLEDALRIIAPFASAWREVLGTYAHFAMEDPLRFGRNFQRTMSAAQNADPDNDGRGFFFNDPTTGVMSFMFPGSGAIAKALTGINSPLKAPVKRLSQGMQVYPAIGPFVQVAASFVLKDAPETDKLVELLLPYGRKNLSDLPGQLVPQWLTKMTQAFTANKGKMDTVYANTYMETVRALSASGDYNLDDPVSVKKLQSDAKTKAKWLTGLRALSQLLGPTAGASDFKIPTKEGDMYWGELSKEFYKLQTADYDNSVQTFLDQFGDDVGLYVSSKSRALVDGLEATSQFGDWERKHGGLISDFPDVASYLAPGGDDFSFSVWDRQLNNGSRERLTDKQMLELSDQRIGSAKYRWAKQQIGAFPTDENRALLKQYRQQLHDQYPGFPLVTEFTVGEFDNKIEQLTNLMDDPRTAGNDVADSIRTYLAARAYTQQSAFNQFGTTNIKQSKQTQSLRDALASIGEMLTVKNPEFGRIWQRLLSGEVEQ